MFEWQENRHNGMCIRVTVVVRTAIVLENVTAFVAASLTIGRVLILTFCKQTWFFIEFHNGFAAVYAMEPLLLPNISASIIQLVEKELLARK